MLYNLSFTPKIQLAYKETKFFGDKYRLPLKSQNLLPINLIYCIKENFAASFVLPYSTVIFHVPIFAYNQNK